MAVPFTRVHAMNTLIVAEMFSADLPYFGVNVFDVDADKLDLYGERMQTIATHFAGLDGFRPHFRAMRDYGSRKRLLRINHYSTEVDLGALRSLIGADRFQRDWEAVMEVVEEYEFFVVHDQS